MIPVERRERVVAFVFCGCRCCGRTVSDQTFSLLWCQVWRLSEIKPVVTSASVVGLSTRAAVRPLVPSFLSRCPVRSVLAATDGVLQTVDGLR